MGRINDVEALQAAQRYRKWKSVQDAPRSAAEQAASEQVEAQMLDRRRNFLLAGDRVFFESIVDGSDLLPMRYLALGQLAARAVGRIHLPRTQDQGDGYATGFLVAPGLMMTNWHVLRSAEFARAATFTLDAEDGLDGLPMAPRVFLLEPWRLHVADQELDFCVVAVAPRALDGTRIESYGYLKLYPDTGKIVRDEYATIIQHPNGRQKHIACRNNRIAVYVYDADTDGADKAQNNFLYYSTDTLKGSSGAPVLSDQWFVVALHRRGVPKTRKVGGVERVVRVDRRVALEGDSPDQIAYVSNEGVRISRVLARLDEMAGRKDGAAPIARECLRAISESAGNPASGPVATRSVGYTALAPRARGMAGATPAFDPLEVVRRKLASFPEDVGYDPGFLQGFPLPLPEPSVALRLELAPRTDRPQDYLLPFRHFTTAMHARRRLPVFAALNIDGALKPERLPARRPSWSYDPRIDEDHQPDDSIFSSLLQRGHMAARDYVVWGDDDEQDQADVHSFTLTNVCPQIGAFNAHREWGPLEKLINAAFETEGARCSVFVGPIFRNDDPDYDDLRGPDSDAEFGTRVRIPRKFWVILAWAEGGQLRRKGFILDQGDELDDAGPLEIDIEAPTGVEEVDIDVIESKTDLAFG